MPRMRLKTGTEVSSYRTANALMSPAPARRSLSAHLLSSMTRNINRIPPRFKSAVMIPMGSSQNLPQNRSFRMSLRFRRKAKPANQLLKSGVLSQAVEDGFDIEVDHAVIALFQGTFQPVNGFASFIESRQDHCLTVVRSIPRLGNCAEAIDHLARLSFLPGNRVNISECSIRKYQRVFTAKPHSPLNTADRLGQTRLLGVGESQHQMSYGKIRIEIERALQLLDGLIVGSCVIEAPADVRIDDQREWIEFLRLADFVQLFLEAAHSCEILVVPVMRRRIVGVEFQRMLKLPLRGGPAPVVVKVGVGQ